MEPSNEELAAAAGIAPAKDAEPSNEELAAAAGVSAAPASRSGGSDVQLSFQPDRFGSAMSAPPPPRMGEESGFLRRAGNQVKAGVQRFGRALAGVDEIAQPVGEALYSGLMRVGGHPLRSGAEDARLAGEAAYGLGPGMAEGAAKTIKGFITPQETTADRVDVNADAATAAAMLAAGHNAPQMGGQMRGVAARLPGWAGRGLGPELGGLAPGAPSATWQKPAGLITGGGLSEAPPPPPRPAALPPAPAEPLMLPERVGVPGAGMPAESIPGETIAAPPIETPQFQYRAEPPLLEESRPRVPLESAGYEPAGPVRHRPVQAPGQRPGSRFSRSRPGEVIRQAPEKTPGQLAREGKSKGWQPPSEEQARGTPHPLERMDRPAARRQPTLPGELGPGTSPTIQKSRYTGRPYEQSESQLPPPREADLYGDQPGRAFQKTARVTPPEPPQPTTIDAEFEPVGRAPRLYDEAPTRSGSGGRQRAVEYGDPARDRYIELINNGIGEAAGGRGAPPLPGIQQPPQREEQSGSRPPSAPPAPPPGTPLPGGEPGGFDPLVPGGRILEKVEPSTGIRSAEFGSFMDERASRWIKPTDPESFLGENRSGLALRHSEMDTGYKTRRSRYAEKGIGLPWEEAKAFGKMLNQDPWSGQVMRKLAETGGADTLTPEEARVYQEHQSTFDRAAQGWRQWAGEVAQSDLIETGQRLGPNYFPRVVDVYGKAMGSAEGDVTAGLDQQVQNAAKRKRLVAGSLDRSRLSDLVPADQSWDTMLAHYDQVARRQHIDRHVIDPANALSDRMKGEDLKTEADFINEWARKTVKGEGSELDRRWFELRARKFRGESLAVGDSFDGQGPFEGRKIEVAREHAGDPGPRYSVTIDGQEYPGVLTKNDLVRIRHWDEIGSTTPYSDKVRALSRLAAAKTIWFNTAPGFNAIADNLGRVASMAKLDLPAATARFTKALSGGDAELWQELKDQGVFEASAQNYTSEPGQRALEGIEGAGYLFVRAADAPARPIAYLAAKARLARANPEWSEARLRAHAKMTAALATDMGDPAFRALAEADSPMSHFILNPAMRKLTQVKSQLQSGNISGLAINLGVPTAFTAALYAATNGDWKVALPTLQDLAALAFLQGRRPAVDIAVDTAKDASRVLENLATGKGFNETAAARAVLPGGVRRGIRAAGKRTAADAANTAIGGDTAGYNRK